MAFDECGEFMSQDIQLNIAMNELIYPTRPNFQSEVVYIADGAIPYQLTKAEFNELPVSEKEKRIRDNMMLFQAYLSLGEESNLIANECKVVHRFSPGIYMREFHMPAGSVIVGHRHAREHVVTVLSGHSTVYTEKNVEEVYGPTTFISYAGVKRILVNHTDAVWTTIHRTDATSIEEAEAELIINENKEYNDAITKVSEMNKETYNPKELLTLERSK